MVLMACRRQIRYQEEGKMVSMLETENPDACLDVRSFGHTQVSACTDDQSVPDPVERFLDENRFRKD
jgi:hypothetical protein